LAAELAASLAHLRRVERDFWERDWRGGHRGLGAYPESYLWDAVHSYLDLLVAVQARHGKPWTPSGAAARLQ